MNKMNDINYGFVDNDFNIYPDNDEKWENSFAKKYYLQSPRQLIKNKYGVCWDQVELERYYLKQDNVKCESYFIVAYDNKIYPTHTFIVVKDSDYYYWFEHSWEPHRGIHKFDNLDELLKTVKKYFIKSVKEKEFEIFIYQYNKPKYGLKCIEFMDYCENGEKIEIG